MTSHQLSRSQLAARALIRLLLGFAILLAMLLLSAGTMAYWEAWTYMVVLFVPMILALVYLLVNDPELLERRMRTREKDEKQNLIIKTGAIFYLLTFLVPGFDRRFGLSHVPDATVILADVFVLLGYLLFILVLRENSYASRVVEVERGQRVVTTGPYSIVRHPMYLAALVMYLFTPVALGSWWALIAALPLVAVMVVRIRNEEQHLMNELEGYQEYTQITKYRLIPGVW
ncbi:MAG: S-isoprenylcysteine methyltransferase [Deltaproteobacteria bacterium HGW-Deltaproteobacteria-12]|jgi:protein-S-isoprenylcysteine O-methyltransferase Ste14|nr:MAG: S-isoprenylcysteine methyltransferase [Deltaproteobacteria bacterium HGW-Deltaproteobacteria-12]